MLQAIPEVVHESCFKPFIDVQVQDPVPGGPRKIFIARQVELFIAVVRFASIVSDYLSSPVGASIVHEQDFVSIFLRGTDKALYPFFFVLHNGAYT